MPVTPALLGLQGQFVSSWNVIAAGSVIAAVPTVAVFLRFQRHFVAGLQSGPSSDRARPLDAARRDHRYTVALPEHGRWVELAAWGPHGATTAPSRRGRPDHGFLTPADAAPVEYATDAVAAVHRRRPGDRDVRRGPPRAAGASSTSKPAQGQLTATFADEPTGLRAAVRYRMPPGTDVVQRWVELTNTGEEPLQLIRGGSAGFCVPTPDGARLSYLWGQWAQEFQLDHVCLGHGAFTVGSAQGVPGHAYFPWLAVWTRRARRAPPGVSPWTGPATGRSPPSGTPCGLTRVRAGRAPARRARSTSPPGGRRSRCRRRRRLQRRRARRAGPGLARYQRRLAGDRGSARGRCCTTRGRPPASPSTPKANSSSPRSPPSSGWRRSSSTTAGSAAATTTPAASVTGRPTRPKFPDGFDAFVDEVRASAWTSGCGSSRRASARVAALRRAPRLGATRARPADSTAIRNQYLLDLGRPTVADVRHGPHWTGCSGSTTSAT